MNNTDQILTVLEVAIELRCSKAHVYKAINGQVPGVTRLPAITMGRRRLIRRSSLEHWKEESERCRWDDKLTASHSVHTVNAGREV